MAWDKHHKSQTKDKILQSAAKLFTRYGFDNISINQIMSDAALTRGAFYAHFSSKSDVYAQSIAIAGKLAKQDQLAHGNNSFNVMSQRYLSKEHRDEELTHLCPLAFLATDINQQQKAVKDTYTKVFNGFVQHAEHHTNNRESALQSAALMIGGLALSRALNDETLSDELLLACQHGVDRLVD